MIFDISRGETQRGYVTDEGVGIYRTYFATANAGFRREALEAAGGFDPRFRTSEDVDVSFRVAQAGYEQYYEPSAQVLHYSRSTLRAMMRQWLHYGLSRGLLIKKHRPPWRIEVLAYSPFGERRELPRILFRIPFFTRGVIFIGSYLLMHLFWLAAAVALALGAWTVAAGAGLLAAVTTVLYFQRCWRVGGFVRAVAFSVFRYLVESAWIIGGVLGGIRRGVVVLEATRPALDRNGTTPFPRPEPEPPSAP